MHSPANHPLYTKFNAFFRHFRLNYPLFVHRMKDPALILSFFHALYRRFIRPEV